MTPYGLQAIPRHTPEMGQDERSTPRTPKGHIMEEHQPPAPPPVWDHIRLRYEQAQETVAQIAASIGLSPNALSRKAKAEGWLLRSSNHPQQQQIILPQAGASGHRSATVATPPM